MTLKYQTMKKISFTNRIKELLEERKKSQRWLAEQIDMHPCTVSAWCRNLRQPYLFDTVVKLCFTLEVDYDQIIVRHK